MINDQHLILHYMLYAVFVCQIVLVSGGGSFIWRSRRMLLLSQFPEAKYPDYYVTPEHTEYSRIYIRRLLDNLLIAAGLVFLLYLYFTRVADETVAQLMLVVGVLQLIPYFLSSFWCRKNAALSQELFPSSVREASFVRRTVANYLNRTTIVTTYLLYGVLFVLGGVTYYSGAVVDTPQLLSLLVFSGLVAAFSLVKAQHLVKGKAENNFTTKEARFFQVQKQLQQLNWFVQLYAVFVVSLIAVKYLGLPSISVLLLTSLFFQYFILIASRSAGASLISLPAQLVDKEE